MKKVIGIIVALVFVCLPLIIPLLQKGYFVSHDGGWAVIRLAEMYRELSDLQFPPRWAGFLNHGYGYPLFLFTYPLPYYIAAVFHFIGLGLIDSIKLLFAVSTVIATVGMFVWARGYWGVGGGMISALLYAYAPFRLIDIVVRGSIGESVAFALYPWLCWGVKKVVEEKSNRWMALCSLFFALLVTTHNTSALLFIPLIILYAAVLIVQEKNRQKQYRGVMYLAISFIVGFALAAYFWLPALLEQKFTVLSRGALQNLSDQFIPMAQLFAFWIPKKLLPVHIGMVHVALFILSAIIAWVKKKYRLLFSVFGLYAFFVLICMLPITKPVWDILPLFSSIDFSWRMLGPLTLVLSFAGGAIIYSRLRIVILSIALSLLAVTIYPITKPLIRIDYGDTYYANNDGTTTAFDELMPLWVVEKPRNLPAEKVVIKEGEGEMEVLENRSNKLTFTANMDSSGLVEVQTIYFPGWTMFIDGLLQKPLIHNEKGTMMVQLPKGYHQVQLIFTNTPIRTFGEILSVLSLSTIAVMLFFPYAKKHHT